MRLLTLIAASFAAFALPAAADDCSEIVAATVAELRAGETGWDDRAEAIARRAAGAACVKATAAATTATDGPAAQTDAAAAAAPAVAATQAQDPDATAVPEEEADDGKAGWKFLGFDVNKVDGSPSQKPYDRKR